MPVLLKIQIKETSRINLSDLNTTNVQSLQLMKELLNTKSLIR